MFRQNLTPEQLIQKLPTDLKNYIKNILTQGDVVQMIYETLDFYVMGNSTRNAHHVDIGRNIPLSNKKLLLATDLRDQIGELIKECHISHNELKLHKDVLMLIKEAKKINEKLVHTIVTSDIAWGSTLLHVTCITLIARLMPTNALLMTDLDQTDHTVIAGFKRYAGWIRSLGYGELNAILNSGIESLNTKIEFKLKPAATRLSLFEGNPFRTAWRDATPLNRRLQRLNDSHEIPDYRNLYP